ncbi:putative polyketide synthase [Nemania sp. FL0031]|nr:putative polyketide synthase [Nemania sp. FL0031]
MPTPNSGRVDDPACIVGMSCRLPGGISSPSGLWDFLMRKGCAQGPAPKQRFNNNGFYLPGSARGGTMNVSGGYFLQDDVREFDNAFFGIHNLEAASMDPQQRKLLEIVFECFEHSGTSLDRMSGSNTGVFVGNFTLDHQTMQSRDPDAIHRFSATGCGTTILANRISHVFNLQGPSFTLDTACSSSLYALHCAVTSLSEGDCEAAIVAAVNLIMSPEQTLAAAKSGVLSPTSTCHTFDVGADGYGRAEAMNCLYLKPLSSALRDCDKVWAIIRSTAVNANGRTLGITQPSADLQEAVIRKAYSKAMLSFRDTDYVECHGTGTPVGDVIEVDALGRCFNDPARGSPLLIGSSKPGLGHSEAASGLTALIKVALALDQGQIPPTYGVKIVNPKLQLERLNMKVATELEIWPRELRRASVNAFGYGGANAHCILESTSSYMGLRCENGLKRHNELSNNQIIVLPISAASTESLKARIRQVREFVEANDSSMLESISHTLAERLTNFTLRSALLFKRKSPDNNPHILDLNTALNGPLGTKSGASHFGFVFTGQGAQYPGMAKELALHDTQFRATIKRLDAFLRELPVELTPRWSLEGIILDPLESNQINDANRSQPACTAVQIALVDLLRSWGVNPTAVVGHSSGEIAAAYAAGLLSAHQAILAAYFRGRAVDELTTAGSMMVAGISAATADTTIRGANLEDEVWVACINSPESVTLSGTTTGINHLFVEIQERGHFARKLATGGKAYHSPMVREAGERYKTLLEPHLIMSRSTNGESPNMQELPKMYSSAFANTHGEALLLDGQAVSAEYWQSNLEKPVQFLFALETLLKKHRGAHLVEIGPHTALKGSISQICSPFGHLAEVPYSGTLVRNQDSDLCLKRLAGELHMRGQNLVWEKVNGLTASVGVSHLPPYPWDYSSGLKWQEPRASVELRNRQNLRHELLGTLDVAGTGIGRSWRNILNLAEVPWVCDHKLESQIVFPAAAYIAIAIEALSQSRPTTHSRPSFALRHMSISTALVIPEDETKEKIEIHTTLSPQVFSRSSSSKFWFDFSISSFVAGQATLHCVGTIRRIDQTDVAGSAREIRAHGLDEWPHMDIWYDQFAREGLKFGTSFKSITKLRTDGARSSFEAEGETQIVPGVVKPYDTKYPIHPITIDACIQVAVMGSAAGCVSDTGVYLPVFIEDCQVCTPALGDLQAKGVIRAGSAQSSPSTRIMKSNLRAVSEPHQALVKLSGVRMVQYRTTINDPPTVLVHRQPFLRLQWKPDFSHLDQNTAYNLSNYIMNFKAQCRDADLELADHESLMAIGALIDLLGHKNPLVRVVEVGKSCSCDAKRLQKLLDGDTSFRRYGSWQSCQLSESGSLQWQDKDLVNGMETMDRPFDLLYASRSSTIWDHIDVLPSLLAPKGIVLASNTPVIRNALRRGQFRVVDIPEHRILMGLQPLREINGIKKTRNAILVVHNPSSAVTRMAEALASHLQNEDLFSSIQVACLSEVGKLKLCPETICISLAELENEFLASMDQSTMDHLRFITNTVTTILWLTGTDLLGEAPNPDLSLSNGLSRSLMLEQPALRFIVMDVGHIASDGDWFVQDICSSVVRVLLSCDHDSEREFILKDGLLQISRLSPSFDTNLLFRRRFEKQENVVKVKLSAARPSRISLDTFGGNDKLHFEQVHEPASAIPEGFIDVSVKVVSLNAKDVYSLKGRIDTREATTALEFSGVVTAVGPGNTAELFQPGDSVVVGMPCHLAMTQRVPVWAAFKLKSGERYADMATLPTIYGTALFALNDRSRLTVGESILVHGGAGAFGFAALTVAKNILGTTSGIYTTAGSDVKKKFIAAELGIPEANIFYSRDVSFASGIRSATGGRGVDVVINFLTGDLMQASWECIAPFGRFIEIGKRDLLDAGRLDMRVFLRNATFTAFDFSDLYYQQMKSQNKTFSGLLADVFRQYRLGYIRPPPITSFAAADVGKAYRFFSSEARIGKIVLSFEEEDSMIPIAPSRYLTLFSSQKVYLLVGCLGGLGRSLTRWMFARGARNFVFLGRSGCDQRSARELVSRLTDMGANVQVIRGDVVKRSDVDRAVAACLGTERALGGVVQAAMGLQEALFVQMSSEGWQTSILPKWRGSWNLHSAIKGFDKELDFFLLTSSLSGSVGTATESNYCAANGFLDTFAHWRRCQGKPAVSVGLGMISEVGYLHDHPEIEALLLRKGIQPLNEAEFLQVIDLALAGYGEPPETKTSGGSNPAASHILTGLEPLRFCQLRSQGYDVDFSSAHDPRLSILAAALEAQISTEVGGLAPAHDTQGAVSRAKPWFRAVPSQAAAHLMSEASADTLQVAMLKLVRKRFSSLVLTPIDQIGESKPLSQFGVDSMIASEFRTWFWTAFKIDVPFLDIMSADKTLCSLADYVANKLEESGED